jgi:hypothetical protein
MNSWPSTILQSHDGPTAAWNSGKGALKAPIDKFTEVAVGITKQNLSGRDKPVDSGHRKRHYFAPVGVLRSARFSQPCRLYVLNMTNCAKEQCVNTIDRI